MAQGRPRGDDGRAHDCRRQLYPSWNADAPGDEIAERRPDTFDALFELHGSMLNAPLDRRTRELDEAAIDALRRLGYLE